MKKNYSLILRKIIFAFNSISVIGIAIFILYTTRKICDAYVASDFLEKVNAIPANPSALVGEILVLVAIMGISFICREKFVRENTGVYYLTLLIDFCASFFIVYRLDFNYNGILLWVFANLIAHIKDMGGKYVLAVISLLSYIGTNHGIISVSTKIFSVNDYIKVYDIGIQKVLYWLYNLLTSLNIILFFVFCVFIIIEQSGTIDEVKKLYFKLSQTNEELQQANEKLQEYAVMKEKMGETKERNRLAREIHDTLGHTLTGISAGVDACIAMIDTSPEVTKGQLELISKVTRDVFMVLSDDFYKYVSLNVIFDLDNQIANDRNFKKEYFFDTVLDIGKYHESQYALPYEVVPTLMFVNKTLLEQEGIEVPNENWTWSTMEQIVDQITKDKNGDGVIDQFGTYNYTWKEAVYSNGAELFDKDGKKAFFSGTKVNEAVKFVKKLNEMNGGREVTQNDFDSGNVAFMPLAFSEYRTYKTYPYKIKKYTSFQWDCTSMPAGPGGHNTSEVDALLMTIGNKSKHKELAWEFLKMLTSDSSIQREIFEYSQGASVLKYVTGSRYAESMIRKDMDVDERGIDNRLLSDAIENGRINPKFSKYPEAMALAENEIDDIYKNEKNIDSSLKVFQRSITKFLNQ